MSNVGPGFRGGPAFRELVEWSKGRTHTAGFCWFDDRYSAPRRATTTGIVAQRSLISSHNDCCRTYSTNGSRPWFATFILWATTLEKRPGKLFGWVSGRNPPIPGARWVTARESRLATNDGYGRA